MKNEKVFSPINGQIIPIEQVSDPVFSEKMLGDGIAVRPELKVDFVCSPCDGVIQTVHSSYHAVAILTPSGYEVLIHTGIDTVTLEGKGFKALVEVGQTVKKGDKLLEVDFSFVSQNAPSIDVIMLVTNMTEEVALTKNPSPKIKCGEEIFIIADKSSNLVFPQSLATNSTTDIISDPVDVINPTGIHARPAARIFQVANKFSSKIDIEVGEKKGNAKSIVSILGLGIKFNDKIQVIASGNDAQEAVYSLVEEIKSGLGEVHAHVPVSNQKTSEEAVDNEKTITDFSKEATLKGVLASPGLVIGKSLLMVEEEIQVEENSTSISFDMKLLEDSVSSTKLKLVKDIEEAKELKQNTKVEVYSAHLSLLEDPTLFDFAKDKVSQAKTAGFAWRASINHSIEILKSTKDVFLIERVADLRDLERRVLKVILGIQDEKISYPKDTIIIAQDLVPSDLSKFDSNVKGVILSLGSSTSHASLILRNMGTVALVAVGASVLNVPNGTDIILDSNEGLILINPEAKKLEELSIKQKELEAIKAANISKAKLPAITIDGVRVSVKGNVSNGNETEKAFELGGEGVGLLRTEFLFFNSHSEPSIEEQHTLYQYAVDAMQGGSVTLRTLDVGGDKPLSFIHIGHEENPIMGLRGVRNYVRNKEVFLNQIRAILKVKPLMLCKIMLPMVAEVSELIDVRQMIEAEMAKQGIKDKIEIGTMVEVPAAALISDKIAKHADFLSIGTNDLAQYTLAMDRGNPNLTGRLKNLNPALLKMIKMTVEGGNKYGIPTAVCGAMASEVQSIPVLIGLGVREFSTSMGSIPDVKALIRTLDSKKCIEVANQALELDTSEEVIDLVNKEFFSH